MNGLIYDTIEHGLWNQWVNESMLGGIKFAASALSSFEDTERISGSNTAEESLHDFN